MQKVSETSQAYSDRPNILGRRTAQHHITRITLGSTNDLTATFEYDSQAHIGTLWLRRHKELICPKFICLFPLFCPDLGGQLSPRTPMETVRHPPRPASLIRNLLTRTSIIVRRRRQTDQLMSRRRYVDGQSFQSYYGMIGGLASWQYILGHGKYEH